MRISKSTKTDVKASANTSKVYKQDLRASTDTDKALQHIRAAIDILGKSGNKDDVTKDSIANLGVVYLDLSGKK